MITGSDNHNHDKNICSVLLFIFLSALAATSVLCNLQTLLPTLQNPK